MFINLIKVICATAGARPYVLGRDLGYKTASAFQRVISGTDLRLTVLLAVCNALEYQITITDKNNKLVVNVSDYYERQKERKSETE